MVHGSTFSPSLSKWAQVSETYQLWELFSAGKSDPRVEISACIVWVGPALTTRPEESLPDSTLVIRF